MRSVSIRTSVLSACLALSCLVAASSAFAQVEPGDPVAVSPEHFRVLLDNDYVRILDVRFAPGEKDKMHAHPSSAYFVMSGDKMRFHLERSQRDGELRRGSVTLQGTIEGHSVENTGSEPIHFIMFENKGKTADEMDGDDPVKVSKDMYQEISKNDRFRVLNVTIPPGERTEVHAQPASAYYSLAMATATVHGADGSTADVAFRPSGAGFLEASAGQAIENTGSTPVRLLLFELLP